MKPNFFHQLASSFVLWTDHEILNKGEAYQNVSGALFSAGDNKFAGYKIWSSPYSQWVADASINGANIPTGVFVNGSMNGRNQNGLKINFNEGKVIFNNSFSGGNITASYAVKDFNIYITNEDDTSLLFKNKYVPKPKTPQELAAIPADSNVFPCIFIKFNQGENEPFAFGGMDECKYEARVFILSDDIFKLDAALSILQDSNKKCFPIISNSDLPFNIFGDLKSGNYYNYNQLVGFSTAHIEKVKIQKLTEIANNSINPKCFAGYADFQIFSYRYPRI